MQSIWLGSDAIGGFRLLLQVLEACRCHCNECQGSEKDQRRNEPPWTRVRAGQPHQIFTVYCVFVTIKARGERAADLGLALFL